MNKKAREGVDMIKNGKTKRIRNGKTNFSLGHMVMALGEENFNEFYDSYAEAYAAYEEFKADYPEEEWEHYETRIDQFECWGGGKYQSAFVERADLTPRQNLKSAIEKTRRAFHECLATGEDGSIVERYFDTLQVLVDLYDGS